MTTTAPDVIRLKLERQFDTVDANNDGYVDWSDYQQLVDRFISAYKLGKNDPRAGGIQAFYQMYWQELLRHAQPNGQKLSKEHFIEANRLASVDTSRLNIVEGCGHAIFDCMDANGDNEVSKEEFETFLRKVWQVSQPDAIEAFHRMDLNGDGHISRQEFIRAAREYFYSNDPDTAGSLFFGQV
ncbi:EF-hand domain-containing protein [Streptomyces sp. MOE7]|uniref:EF-hand domain-containing protein n=1 Tax=Streptomyces sp. MOE7 TaxID=1961713 RepID=UPI0009FE199E|nr:EF-hand domain-containing protein [Streptomyces sp. MOE7]ARH92279.1 calcium-binding protein [Streptomyces sp. MOE7]